MLLILVMQMNKEVTADKIENYIVENYGTMKHDKYAMSEAIEEIACEVDLNQWDVFLLIIENKPIEGAYTHSYGFHTRYGRSIIERFQNYYYEMV